MQTMQSKLLYLLVTAAIICLASVVQKYEVSDTMIIPVPLTNITTYPLHGNLTDYAGIYTIYTANSSREGYDWLVYVTTEEIQVNITVFRPCPNHQYRTGNVLRAIRPPVVAVSGSNFNISLAYLRENITYTIDLCPTNVSSCGWGPAASTSAPTATFPGAIGHYDYPAYLSKSAVWSLSAANCSEVLAQSNMTFEQQLQCRSQDTYCVNVTAAAGTPFIDYVGSLYVKAHKDGNVIYLWEYPFIHRFHAYTNVVAETSVSSKVSFSVTSFVSPHLVIKIKTTTLNDNMYLDNPIYDSSLSLTATAAARVQYWEYKSITALTSYSGDYRFGWILMPDNTAINIIVQISLVSQPTVSQSYKLNTAVKTYKDPAFLTPTAGPFTAFDTIYIASIYEGGDSLYNIEITNIWICYPTSSGIVPHYDPARGLYGCRQSSAVVPAGNILHVYGGALDPRWEATYRQNISINGRPAAGIELKFDPSILIDQIYYIHVESRLVPRRLRRRTEQLAVDVQAFYVAREERLQELSRQTTIMSVMIGLVSALMFTAAICVVTYCVASLCIRRAKQRRRLHEMHKQLMRHSLYLKVKETPPENINDVLDDKVMIEKFASFCQKIHCQEPLTFYLAAKNYQATPAGADKDNAFAKLYKEFIAHGAPHELNIPDKMRQNAPAMLNSIIDLVVLEMNQNSFGRFYKELQGELLIK